MRNCPVPAKGRPPAVAVLKTIMEKTGLAHRTQIAVKYLNR